MIPIMFVPGWPDESVDTYTKRLALQSPGNTGRWKKIYATADATEANYAICQDNPLSIHHALKYGFKIPDYLYQKRSRFSLTSN